jgi:hypothetical protein
MNGQYPQQSQSMFPSYMTENVNESALNLRINTDPLLKQVELFLRGQKEIILYDSKLKNHITQLVQYGEPLANDKGIQNIMQLLYMIFNKDVVQGNLLPEEINQIVFDLKMDLARELMIHNNEWGIRKDMRTYINRTIEKSAKLYLSRTKDNKERDSYIPMIRQVETNTINNNEMQQQKGAFNWFGMNKQQNM